MKFDPHDSDSLILSDIRELLYLLLVGDTREGERRDGTPFPLSEFKSRRLLGDNEKP